MKTSLSILALVLLFTVVNSCENESKPAGEKKIEVGQVWKYQNRPGEDSSTITILKVDRFPSDTIVHVRVNGVNIFSPRAEGGYTHSIQHVPFSYVSLLNSVTEMTGTTDNLPDFADGYREWRVAFDNGRAGYFRISVKEAVQRADDTQRPK